MNKNFDVEKRFGAKLAYIRKSKKFSQMKLAEIVDMNFNYIGQIERGEANVTIKTMHALADALDIELRGGNLDTVQEFWDRTVLKNFSNFKFMWKFILIYSKI